MQWLYGGGGAGTVGGALVQYHQADLLNTSGGPRSRSPLYPLTPLRRRTPIDQIKLNTVLFLFSERQTK